MTTGKNRLISDSLIPNAPRGVKLDLAAISTADDAEAMLAKIISDETEKKRESERVRNEMVPQGLLGTMIDYVDTKHWDEYLQDTGVLSACAGRAGVKRTRVLDFAIEKCSPSNWRALFWMHAWYEQIYRNTEADMAEAAKDLEKLYETSKAEEARVKAKAAADARHGKPGGSRELKEKIRAIWATGKYESRARCAEQEFESIGFNTYDTAKAALAGTDDPKSWPAKKVPKKPRK